MIMNDRLGKIKSGAYWRVNIRPTTFEKDRISTLSEVRQIVEACSVRLRGWTYPQITPEETTSGIDWIQSGVDWEEFIEYWRFYQSAQFIHYFSVEEDYPEVKERAIDRITGGMGFGTSREPSGYISIFSTLFRITEIYEFAMRLAQKDIMAPGVYISITLHGIKNYQLFTWDQQRHFPRTFVAAIGEIPLESTMGIEELLAKGHDEAINQTIYLFERFNWVDPSREIMIEEQKKLLERRL
jgi:hypothetical protein